MMCFDEFNETMLSHCGHYYGRLAGRAHTRLRTRVGQFEMRQHLGVEIAEISCNFDGIERSRAGIRRDDNEHMFLLVQRAGSTEVVHNDQEVLLTPGECLLLDSTRTAGLNYQRSGASFLSVHLPRALCLEGRTRLPMIGQKLGASHPMHASLLNLLLEQAEGFDADGLFDFVSLMFRPDRSVQDAGWFRDATSRYRFILDVMDRNLSDADLTLDHLANLVGVSRRQLQREFRAQGTSFTHCLQTRRIKLFLSEIDRALRLQRKPAIGQLAFRCGFGDISHFNQVFRTHTGLTPRGYLAAHSEITH